MKKNKLMLILIVVISLLITVGCWNYREIEDLAIVTGAAVDMDPKTGKYIVTVELISPSQQQKETQISTTTMTIKGRTIFGAVRNFIEVSGKKLYWSHARVIIISEEIARKNIAPVLDWVKRDAEVRTDMYILVSREKTAGEILESKVELGKIVSYQLENAFKSGESISKFPRVQLRHFINDLSANGKSAVAATVNLKPENGKKVPQIHGAAVFKGAKQVGWFNGYETRSLLWLRDKIKGGALVEEAINIEGRNVNTTLEIYEGKTNVKPVLTDEGEIIMNVDIHSDVTIAEFDGTIKPSEKDVQNKIEREIKKDIKKRIKVTITKAQAYGSDAFGFGQAIEREMPDLWKQIESNWDEIYPQIGVKINIGIHIRGSGLAGKNIEVGD
ncbi:MAG: Ger(x)C family spore germination protein [Firmicutes bacterium]|nr:Ger(x)C family spore germination protein [Bacillota bacterium]